MCRNRRQLDSILGVVGVGAGRRLKAPNPRFVLTALRAAAQAPTVRPIELRRSCPQPETLLMELTTSNAASLSSPCTQLRSTGISLNCRLASGSTGRPRTPQRSTTWYYQRP